MGHRRVTAPRSGQVMTFLIGAGRMIDDEVPQALAARQRSSSSIGWPQSAGGRCSHPLCSGKGVMGVSYGLPVCRRGITSGLSRPSTCRSTGCRNLCGRGVV